jgi:hypothetical protein
MENNLDWDSDDDSVVEIKDFDAKGLGSSKIFGFHPYKDIMFVSLLPSRVVAYHFESSKIHDLGSCAQNTLEA